MNIKIIRIVFVVGLPLLVLAGYLGYMSSARLAEGRSCFLYLSLKTETSPYEVKEYLDLFTKGNNVDGKKYGTQVGPDLSNGYYGEFSGVLNKKILSGKTLFEIEGSTIIEHEEYEIQKEKIIKKRWPLGEIDGELQPNKTNPPVSLQEYNLINCTELDTGLAG